jgi:hypothetical protein
VFTAIVVLGVVGFLKFTFGDIKANFYHLSGTPVLMAIILVGLIALLLLFWIKINLI